MKNKKELNNQKKLSRDLSLLDPEFFKAVADNNIEFANFLLEPVFKECGERRNIISAQILSLDIETDLISQVLLVETEGHYFYLILIPDDPEETEFPLKLISALDDHYFKKLYPIYGEETDLDTVYFGKNPVEGLKTDSPLSKFQFVNLETQTPVPEFGAKYIVNGKYKDSKDQDFINVIEDLESTRTEEAKSELIKDIHKKFKN